MQGVYVSQTKYKESTITIYRDELSSKYYYVIETPDDNRIRGSAYSPTEGDAQLDAKKQVDVYVPKAERRAKRTVIITLIVGLIVFLVLWWALLPINDEEVDQPRLEDQSGYNVAQPFGRDEDQDYQPSKVATDSPAAKLK